MACLDGHLAPEDLQIGRIASAYVASWVLGLLTPGAPAGLGVREASLIGLLAGVVTNHSALGAAVVLSRLMSVAGDLIYFSVFQVRKIFKMDSNSRKSGAG